MTSILVQTLKNPFFARFCCKFVAFFQLFSKKMLKMTILTSVWGAQHRNAGRNIQHTINPVPFTECVLRMKKAHNSGVLKQDAVKCSKIGILMKIASYQPILLFINRLNKSVLIPNKYKHIFKSVHIPEQTQIRYMEVLYETFSKQLCMIKSIQSGPCFENVLCW